MMVARGHDWSLGEGRAPNAQGNVCRGCATIDDDDDVRRRVMSTTPAKENGAAAMASNDGGVKTPNSVRARDVRCGCAMRWCERSFLNFKIKCKEMSSMDDA